MESKDLIQISNREKWQPQEWRGNIYVRICGARGEVVTYLVSRKPHLYSSYVGFSTR